MYYAALVIIAIIFIWRICVGLKRGMVKEITSLIAMVAAGFSLMLILGAWGNYMNQRLGKTFMMIVVLVAVSLIYKVLHLILSSMKLIAKAPVIHLVDKLLGAVLGVAESVVIIGIIVYLVKNWGLGLLS